MSDTLSRRDLALENEALYAELEELHDRIGALLGDEADDDCDDNTPDDEDSVTDEA